MIHENKNLKGTIGLAITLSKAEFKQRNEGSYLGIFWYLLNPLLLFTLLYLVFSDRLSADINLYPLYLFIGIIMFNFFQTTTSESIRTIQENKGIIKSINFPKESLILSKLLRNTYSHIFEIILFVILMILLKINPLSILWYIPLFMLLFFFTYGLSLILAGITVYFADMEYIWTFFSRLLWFATPIFYEIGGQSKLMIFNLLNPLYHFINISRELIIYTKTPQIWTGLLIGIASLMMMIIGIILFRKLKYKFAERV